jgi:hypothetical protein
MVVHSAPHLRLAVTRAAVAIAVAFVLLVPAPVAAGGGSPMVFNARADFRASPNEANPSGPWSYRRAAEGFRGPLLSEFGTDHFLIPGLETWHGQELSTPGNKLPFVGVNTSGVDQHPFTIDWPAGALLVHPGDAGGVMIVWRSPKQGRVQIRASMIDRESTCGDGVRWAISAHPVLASGVIPNGGTAKVSLGAIHVDLGDRVALKIGPGPNGDVNCDSTQIKFVITLTPTG